MDNTKLYESDLWKSSNSLIKETEDLIKHAKFFDDPILKRDLIECSQAVSENLEGAFRDDRVNLAFLTNGLSFIRGLNKKLELTKVKMYISKETYNDFVQKTNDLADGFKELISKYEKETDFV